MRFFFLLHCARHMCHHTACEIFLFHPQLLVKELMIKWHSWVRMHLMAEMVLSSPAVLALDSPMHGCFLVISTQMLQRCSPVVTAWEAKSILAHLWRPQTNVGHCEVLSDTEKDLSILFKAIRWFTWELKFSLTNYRLQKQERRGVLGFVQPMLISRLWK